LFFFMAIAIFWIGVPYITIKSIYVLSRKYRGRVEENACRYKRVLGYKEACALFPVFFSFGVAISFSGAFTFWKLSGQFKEISYRAMASATFDNLCGITGFGVLWITVIYGTARVFAKIGRNSQREK
jgi:hypothetical protein